MRNIENKTSIPIYTSYFDKMKKINKYYNNPYYVPIVNSLFKDLEKYMTHDKIFYPHQDILNYYRFGTYTKEKYSERYRAQILHSDILDDEIYRLYQESNGYDAIFLLCYEKTGDFCHRYILSDELNNIYGLEIDEWKDYE